MKSILGQEKDRRLYHKKPTKFSVHRLNKKSHNVSGEHSF